MTSHKSRPVPITARFLTARPASVSSVTGTASFGDLRRARLAGRGCGPGQPEGTFSDGSLLCAAATPPAEGSVHWCLERAHSGVPRVTPEDHDRPRGVREVRGPSDPARATSINGPPSVCFESVRYSIFDQSRYQRSERLNQKQMSRPQALSLTACYYNVTPAGAVAHGVLH
eukprot:656593-Prorocentrum_minimum.AAC.1